MSHQLLRLGTGKVAVFRHGLEPQTSYRLGLHARNNPNLAQNCSPFDSVFAFSRARHLYLSWNIFQSALFRDGAVMSTQPIAFSRQPDAVRAIYLLQFLSSWAIRGSEFSLVLFLAAIYPTSLFYISVYGLARSLATVCLGPSLGTYVDSQDRLRAMQLSIVSQRIMVAMSCVMLLYLRLLPEPGFGPGEAPFSLLCFVTLVLLGVAEKMAAVANVVALERDWIVVVADAHGLKRRDFNASLRRVDLACKLVAPSIVGFLHAASAHLAMTVVLLWNIASLLVEAWTAARAYQMTPELASKREVEDVSEMQRLSPGPTPRPASPLMYGIQSLSPVAAWREYIRSPVFLPSFAGCILWWSVLYFGGQLITYLLSVGFTSSQITLLRIASVVTELGGTWLAPILMNRFGPPKAGLCFLLWQVACLVVFAGPVIFGDQATGFVGTALAISVILKRLGLWGLDLATQFMVQEVSAVIIPNTDEL